MSHAPLHIDGPVRRPFRPQSQPDAAARPSLRLAEGIAHGHRRQLRPSVVGVAVGIVSVLIIAAQLALSMMQTSDAYELASLKVQQRDMARVERVLQQNVASLSSPQNLAANAKDLGMVQNVQPGYLRLSDGTILGDPTAVTQSVVTNNVPNATLGAVLGADASLRQADAAAAGAGGTPVPWSGNLPAPITH